MTESVSSESADDTTVKGVMLREAWYYALAANELRRRSTAHRTLLGEPILIGRDAAGKVFALRDTCPHRGTLLSRGAFDGREVECPYHGWRFATDGRCTAIPSQTDTQRPQPADVRAKTYAVAEHQGNVWVYMGDKRESLPPVPEVPALGKRFQIHVTMRFPCNIDLAVIGLMDPAHGAFVHRSALWRDRASIHEKQKRFSPVADRLGWRMDRHRASSNSRAYGLFLGGAPETEITYTLPSVRVEHATTGRYGYCGLTACTPVTADLTDVHHVMYWDVPGGAMWRPLIQPIARRFLDQDRRAVMAMAEGQAFAPSTMLVRDADTQARWYFQLKREWLAAAAEDRAPRNPIAPATLTWRS
ncbi:MAG: aromatic ring-hydroxylating dioxygenase subunit alpha [Rhodospirillaceae bacterium]|nr:MAG: aromatic ring-hydroxylating dioxygenase subunit alpha [Rhodospirillaceae bacterium]